VSLIPLFDAIVAPTGVESGGVALRGVPLAEYEACHLAKDRAARPVILVRSASPPSGERPRDLVLENLRIENRIRCLFERASGEIEKGVFTLVRCTSDNRDTQELFLQVGESSLRALGTDITEPHLLRFLESVAELFRALEREPTRQIMGLWAELFVLTRSEEPRTLLAAWHTEVGEHFDFTMGIQRLEIKSSGNRSRRHQVSFEQVYPPEQVQALIASLFIEPGVEGPSVKDLWDEARLLAGADSALLLKVERQCLQSLGRNWGIARERRFDAERAAESLGFFNIDDVPRVAREQPPGVADLRFESDLSKATPLTNARLKALGGLFSAARLRQS